MEQKGKKEIKQINGFENIDNTSFFSNNQTVCHNPEKFQIDFKNIYPQFKPDGQATMVVCHKNILLDPHTMVELYRIIGENIRKYEEKFGPIEEPGALQKAKEQVGIKKEESTTTNSERPNYLG